jgi:hypothetical protein
MWLHSTWAATSSGTSATSLMPWRATTSAVPSANTTTTSQRVDDHKHLGTSISSLALASGIKSLTKPGRARRRLG